MRLPELEWAVPRGSFVLRRAHRPLVWLALAQQCISAPVEFARSKVLLS